MKVCLFPLAEIWCGVVKKPAGKKRQKLEQWFRGPEGPLNLFAGRILPFDENAALLWGEIMANGEKAGTPRSAIDMMVGAIAQANECTVVTDNERHFHGFKIINPLAFTR
jgi:hypothetical protein